MIMYKVIGIDYLWDGEPTMLITSDQETAKEFAKKNSCRYGGGGEIIFVCQKDFLFWTTVAKYYNGKLQSEWI